MSARARSKVELQNSKLKKRRKKMVEKRKSLRFGKNMKLLRRKSRRRG
jgi:hypothetical protein